MKTDSVSNQLRWVILLLTAAVILPTVCLLWFMNQAVKNERLAVRQELANIYSGELSQAIDEMYQQYRNRQTPKNIQNKMNPLSTVDFLASHSRIEAIFVFDKEGTCIWPSFSSETKPPINTETVFKDAWKTEFQDEDYKQAIRLYESLTESEQLFTVISAQTGMARCCEKLADEEVNLQEKQDLLLAAVSGCMRAAFRSEIETCDSATLIRIMQSNLYLLHLGKKMAQLNAPYAETYKALIWDIYNQLYWLLWGEENWNSFLSTDSWLLAAQTVIELYDNHPDILQGKSDWNPTPAIMEKERLLKLITLSEKSIQQLNTIVPEQLYRNTPKDNFHEITTIKDKNSYYSFIHNDRALSILTKSQIQEYVYPIYEKFNTNAVQCRILDENGRFLWGSSKAPPMLIESRLLKEPFSNWKIELFFSNADIFEDTAKKQVTVYLWTGILVTLLVLSAGAVSIRAVNHQIKMNRLKNDFIATVTHELKTPLASMRLLVDTLLEGNYEGEKTATEYLQLVANENKRLTHLIDSFLTFSRMERNKQVFDLQPIPPAEIAAAASEAMEGKFGNGDCHCDFTCTVADDLPFVSADKDGMVTVLVNLLDNAYKYTNGDKKIELKVYEKDGFVCFAVKDNGIGLSPRAQKKIFNRFYQVDSRLSRRAEGCGLGLSIVKFIVDAHRGMIDVESNPDEGSVFRVRLPKI